MYEIPNLVFADRNGNIYDHPELKSTVRSENFNTVPYELELIDLPEGSKLIYVPGTKPLAYNQMKAGMEEFSGGFAVSALLPPGYLRMFLPSYVKTEENNLPLYAYTAVGWMNDRFVVPAIKVDDNSKWLPRDYENEGEIKAKVAAMLERSPKNRIYKLLANCALDHGCMAAKNAFLGRGELPVPTAPTCNSKCLGCVSEQPAESCPNSKRIDFIPSTREIVEVALNHYELAGEDAIISFGQGCEGDPLTVAETIAKAVKVIKKKAPELTVNVSTNASRPDKVKMLLDAGIDSVKVSLNSVRYDTYDAYYRPTDYSLDDVFKSIEIANRCNSYVSLELLMMPGINDRESETESLQDFLGAYRIDLLQLKNLNIDPDYLFGQCRFKIEEILGVKNMLKSVKKKNKGLKFGCFNRPMRDFDKDFGLPDLKRK